MHSSSFLTHIFSINDGWAYEPTLLQLVFGTFFGFKPPILSLKTPLVGLLESPIIVSSLNKGVLCGAILVRVL